MVAPSAGAFPSPHRFGVISRLGRGIALSLRNPALQLLPQEDIGRLSVSTQAREDISYTAMRDLQAQVADQIRKNPAVVHVTSIVGGNSRNPLNNGSMFVELKPKEERAPLSQVLTELGQATSKVAGIRTYINPQQSLRFGERRLASQYQARRSGA